MSVTVTVREDESGAETTLQIPSDDYAVICTDACYWKRADQHKNGTERLTIVRPPVDDLSERAERGVLYLHVRSAETPS